MKTVYSLDEARSWFLRNHDGQVRCVYIDPKIDGRRQVVIVDNYIDAENFYKYHENRD